MYETRGFILSNQLQGILEECGCAVLNYTSKGIAKDSFYSEERYNDFLNGKDCRQGMGLFDNDEVLEFNKLNDNTLVIVQNDGVETVRYKYVPIFKATMEFKEIDDNNKKVNKAISFKLRKNINGNINFIGTDGNSVELYNMDAIKKYINEKYGNNKLTDWSVDIG